MQTKKQIVVAELEANPLAQTSNRELEGIWRRIWDDPGGTYITWGYVLKVAKEWRKRKWG